MESEQSPNESSKEYLPRIRILNREYLDDAGQQLQFDVNDRRRAGNNTMVTLLFLKVSMVIWLGVALDVWTREVVSFAISDSPTISAADAVALLKLDTSAFHAGRLIEVDRARVDDWAGPFIA